MNISKTKKDIPKRKMPFFFTLKSPSNKQRWFLLHRHFNNNIKPLEILASQETNWSLIKSQTSSKLTCCECDFACLVDHLEEKFFHKEAQPKKVFFILWKPVAPLMKTFNETPVHVSFVVWHLLGMLMHDMSSNVKQLYSLGPHSFTNLVQCKFIFLQWVSQAVI